MADKTKEIVNKEIEKRRREMQRGTTYPDQDMMDPSHSLQTPPETPRSQEQGHRSQNPIAWLATVKNAWTRSAQPSATKEGILLQMANGVIETYKTDTALAAGGAGSGSWINNRLDELNLPVTRDEVAAAVRTAFEQNGIDVQGK